MSKHATSHHESTGRSAGRRRAGWLAVAAGMVLAGAAASAPVLITVEQCIETGTRSVRLPDKAKGSLAARACAECDELQLRFDAGTVFLIGDRAVPYAKFREAATRENLRLDVFYANSNRALTRLRIPAVAGTK